MSLAAMAVRKTVRDEWTGYACWTIPLGVGKRIKKVWG
jgi:hypothetical protein